MAASDLAHPRQFVQRLASGLQVKVVFGTPSYPPPRAVLPNPSFEARPNGKPPGPGRWYGYIFTGPGLASCHWSRLNSNVRHQKNGRVLLQQDVRLLA